MRSGLHHEALAAALIGVRSKVPTSSSYSRLHESVQSPRLMQWISFRTLYIPFLLKR